MRITSCFIAATLMALVSPAMSAPCTPGQRADLAKSGYVQADIKKMCGSASSMFERAYSAKESGDLRSAQQLLELGLRMEPGNVLGKKLLAEVKESSGSGQKFFEQGYNAKESGDLQSAQLLFEQGLQKEPGNALGQKYLAEVKELLSSAQKLFEQGYNAKQAGDLRTAQELFEQGLRIEPGNALGQKYLAEVKEEATRPPSKEDVAARILRQLELRYPLANTTADGADIVAAGAVLVLQKDNLVMNKLYLSNTQQSPPVQNVYENGEITQVGLMGVLSKINTFLSILGNTEALSRSFVHGEKIWVTNIAMQRDGIVFQLMSDPINNERYRGTLKFPYANVLAAEQAAVLVADVLVTE